MIISNSACDTVEDVIPYVVMTVFTMYVALNGYNVVITYALLSLSHAQPMEEQYWCYWCSIPSRRPFSLYQPADTEVSLP